MGKDPAELRWITLEWKLTSDWASSAWGSDRLPMIVNALTELGTQNRDEQVGFIRINRWSNYRTYGGAYCNQKSLDSEQKYESRFE